MSTPLIILASILALCALVLIPLMVIKPGQSQDRRQQHHAQGRQRKQHRKKKKN